MLTLLLIPLLDKRNRWRVYGFNASGKWKCAGPVMDSEADARKYRAKWLREIKAAARRRENKATMRKS